MFFVFRGGKKIAATALGMILWKGGGLCDGVCFCDLSNMEDFGGRDRFFFRVLFYLSTALLDGLDCFFLKVWKKGDDNLKPEITNSRI